MLTKYLSYSSQRSHEVARVVIIVDLYDLGFDILSYVI